MGGRQQAEDSTLYFYGPKSITNFDGRRRHSYEKERGSIGVCCGKKLACARSGIDSHFCKLSFDKIKYYYKIKNNK